jgi:hypothetical protein
MCPRSIILVDLEALENDLDMLEVSHILILHHFIVLFNLLWICLSGYEECGLSCLAITLITILLKCDSAV